MAADDEPVAKLTTPGGAAAADQDWLAPVLACRPRGHPRLSHQVLHLRHVGDEALHHATHD
ncbi:MAG: hypothetical protein ACK5QX_10380, partial [bacterium]